MFTKKRVYLDWAAAAPVEDAALEAFTRATVAFGNPSSPHEEGRAAKTILETARTLVARELEVKSNDVVFTSGATEANNLAIQSVATRARMNGIQKPHLLYLPSAHASIVETMKAMERFGFSIEPLPVARGEIDIEKLKMLIRPDTVLVSTDFVCGETGTVWNTREVKHALPGNVLLHVDAAQAPYEESCERTRTGADLLVFDAQKIGGVRGCGVLVVSRSLALPAILHGGGQEQGRRSGTPSPALAAAFATALTEAGKARAEFILHAHRTREAFLHRISDISNLEVNQGKKGVAHIINMSLIGRDTDYLVALLNEAGFAVSTKSACESDSSEGSRAVRALTNDAARAESTLRVSFGPETKDIELDHFADALKKAVAFLDDHPA